MKPIKLLLTSALLFTLPAAANAEMRKYTFDPSHTQVIFFVNHMGFSMQEGEFHKVDGSLMLDEAQPEKAELNVTIDTNSLDMDEAKWDEHMKSADFFNVAKFPTMTFKSTSVKKTGDQTADVTGDLTLLGVTKPVTLAVKHNKSGKHPMNGKDVAGFSATGKLKRSDFGMTNGVPMVGDDVDIRIEIETFAEEASGTDTGNN